MENTLSNEIKRYEEAGMKVQCTQADGKLTYQTKVDPNTCNGCEHFRLLPDPDPFDWFDDDDQKAICEKCNATIAQALSVFEANSVRIPSWCPEKKAK